MQNTDYVTNYRDSAALITALLEHVQTQGRRVSGHAGDNYRYLIILDWRYEAPTLTLRDLEADTEAGYQDIIAEANPAAFRDLYLTATR